MTPDAFIIAVFTVNKDKVKDFQHAMDGQVMNVWDREVDTCSQFEWTQDASDPCKFVMIETYSSEKDAKEHAQTPWFKEFAAQIQPKAWLSEPPYIVISNGIGGFKNRDQGLYGRST